MRQKPYIIEIIGPAGAGKSTLAQALVESPHKAILGERPLPRDIANLGFYLGNGLCLLPTLLQRPWVGRWYSREEAQRLFYLTGMAQRLQRLSYLATAPQSGDQPMQIVVLDQGPIFDMAQLTEFGPARLQNLKSTRWWRTTLKCWAATLDMVIWLDAPDSVLVPRVMARSKWHMIKGFDYAEASDFLCRYRAAYDVNLFSLATRSPIQVLEFHTDKEDVSTIVQHISRAIVQETLEIQDPVLEYSFV